ncbi:MAG: hypothetical protein AB7G93_12695 [Bdellovibrionales bacterium]
MKTLVVALGLLSNIAIADLLEDVHVLNVKPGQNHLELKLRTKEGPKDSFFLVDIVKSDPEAFEKLAHVINELNRPDKHKLNLDIQSFSVSPSGSYYQSPGILFSGTTDSKPSAVKPDNKKKK